MRAAEVVRPGLGDVVTALVTLDKSDLETPAGHLPGHLPVFLMNDFERGLRRLLGL